MTRLCGGLLKLQGGTINKAVYNFLSGATHTFSLHYLLYPGGCQTRGGGNSEVLGDLRDRAAAGEAAGGEGEETGTGEPAQTNRGGKVSI